MILSERRISCLKLRECDEDDYVHGVPTPRILDSQVEVQEVTRSVFGPLDLDVRVH
jgi:hypothetical protein